MYDIYVLIFHYLRSCTQIPFSDDHSLWALYYNNIFNWYNNSKGYKLPEMVIQFYHSCYIYCISTSFILKFIFIWMCSLHLQGK